MDEWDWGSLADAFGDGGDFANFDFGGFDLSNIDLGGVGYDIGSFDLGSLLSDIDLGGLGYDIGSFDLGGIDLGGIDLGNVDLGGAGYDTGAFDLGGSNLSNVDLGGAGYDTGAFGTNTGTVLGTEGFADAADEVGGGGTGEISTDAEAQPGGFYGNTPNATYDPKTNITTIRDDAGNVIRTIQGPPTSTDNSNIIKDLITKINNLTGSKGNTALLTALLGGLMGLIGKNSYPKGPVGYKGDIPKYTATRGEAVSPTAGGRRPGGANIPSLTGGVTYTKAAHGGLMGLKQGQYLDGATDGMADKIQTSIDGKQPARLSHGEFVVPADVVSHLGNGNSDAGADVLYDMMAKVRKARTGTPKQGKQINPRKYIPA